MIYNTLINNDFGLYDDVIHVIQDFIVGDINYWKKKYDNVVLEMNTLFTSNRPCFDYTQGLYYYHYYDDFANIFRKQLITKINYTISKKISIIFQYMKVHFNDDNVNDDHINDDDNVNDWKNDTNMSINDILCKFEMYGIYRIVFDKLIYKILQYSKSRPNKCIYLFKMTNSINNFNITFTSNVIQQLYNYYHQYYCV